MAYFENTALTNINDLMDELVAALEGAGWTRDTLNAATQMPSANRIGREEVFRAPGTTAVAAGSYIDFHTYFDSYAQTAGIQMCCFTGRKPIADIVSIDRSGNVVTVVTVEPHGFATGDLVFINGTDNAPFHEGCLGSDEAPATVTVVDPTTFTYGSGASGALSGEGGFAMAVYNLGAGRRTYRYATGSRLVLSDSPCDVYGYVDEFRICGVVVQGGQCRTFYMGQSGRDHVPADFASTAFVANEVVGDGATPRSIVLDRASPNLAVGQPLWIISADDGTFEVTTITEIGSPTEIKAVLADGNCYRAGAVVGMDPMPVCTGGHGDGSTTDLGSKTFFFAHHINGTRSNPVGQPFDPEVERADSADGATNPDAAGFYQGRDIRVQRTSGPEGQRYPMPGFVAWPVGYQNDLDIMRVGSTPVEDDYRVFVLQRVDGMALSVGPGATP